VRSLGRRTALGLLLAALAPIGGRAADQPWPVSFGGPFALTDHTGRRVTDRDFRGSWLLVQFGYTGCPDLCLLSLDTLAQALDLLGPAAAARVQPLFITVDPARDTPEALAAFVPAFHPRLVGLSGSEPEIRGIARAYRVHRRKVLTDPARPDEYLIDHSSFTYLTGPDGRFVTLFPYGTEADKIAGIVAAHLGS
jgi:protein SCO1/2